MYSFSSLELNFPLHISHENVAETLAMDSFDFPWLLLSIYSIDCILFGSAALCDSAPHIISPFISQLAPPNLYHLGLVSLKHQFQGCQIWLW
jgi:hypothetical protein